MVKLFKPLNVFLSFVLFLIILLLVFYCHFGANTANLLIQNDGNGTTDPTGLRQVNINEQFTIKAIPNTCYDFDSWKIESGSVTITDPSSATTTIIITDLLDNKEVVITAHFKKKILTLTISSSQGGSTNPSGDVPADCRIPVNVEGNPSSASYSFVNWEVIEGNPSISNPNASSTSITLEQGNASVRANFSRCARQITTTCNTGGTISPQGVISVTCGTSQRFDIAPDSCHRLTDLLIDGISAGPMGSYTFTGIMSDHTIEAVFTTQTYTIAIQANGGGTVTPPSNITVQCGESRTISIAPNTGYHIVDVVVDGTSRGAISSYTFTNVTGNHTISASFAINQFNLTLNVSTPQPQMGSVDCYVIINGTAYRQGTFNIQFDNCTNVTLQAVASGAYYPPNLPPYCAYFIGWSGDSTIGSITMDNNKSITASFGTQVCH